MTGSLAPVQSPSPPQGSEASFDTLLPPEDAGEVLEDAQPAPSTKPQNHWLLSSRSIGRLSSSSLWRGSCQPSCSML